MAKTEEELTAGKVDQEQAVKQAKMKALQAAMSKIEKDFGKGSIMRMGDEKIENVEVIPTGSLGLDVAMGVGGYPKGRIIEVYGPESSGKTTLAIHAIAEAQKQGGIAAFIDAEHAFDRFYAEKLGVDVDNLWISQPDNGEQALQIADQLISSSAVDILVVDSVAALTPKKEIEGDMGESAVGLQARLMSQALRKLTATISKTNTCCIFINQLREKIGVMFGNPETTTGGNALKFYSSVRLDIRRVTSLKDGDNIIGNHVRVKVVKNKVAPPFRKSEFDIMFGVGINKIGEIVDLGVEFDIIQKSGSWYSYNGSKLGQGRDATMTLLRDNPELCEELEGLIKEAIKAHEKVSNAELKERAIAAIRDVGIPQPEKVYHDIPSRLSGGMRQRIMIAMALVCHPKLLICDEPTTALDVTIQAQILRLIKKLRDETNTAVIFISHDMGVIYQMVDRVVVMYAGQFVESAPCKKLFEKPLHPYTIGLQNAIPQINKQQSSLQDIPGSVPMLDNLPEGCLFAPRCPFAKSECFTKKVPLKLYDDHDVRCLLVDEGGWHNE